MLPKIILYQFIRGNIPEPALIKAILVLWPRPLRKSPGTLGPGLVIQQGGRMFMFQAKPRAGAVINKAAFMLGVFVAIACAERPAEAQNGAWCRYINGDGDGEPHCRYATFEQCLADRTGSNTCSPSPYPSSPEPPPLTRHRKH
jgi:hypothetical protein